MLKLINYNKCCQGRSHLMPRGGLAPPQFYFFFKNLYILLDEKIVSKAELNGNKKTWLPLKFVKKKIKYLRDLKVL